MACQFDYMNASAAERRVNMLNAAYASRVDKYVAVAYAALAEGESNNIWALPRPTSSDCCRIPVGVEDAHFHEALNGEDDLIKWLQSKQWITLGQDGKMHPAGALNNPFNQDAIGEFFEQTCAYGVRKALGWVALGPTQLNLYWVDMCGVPKTVQDCWDMYLASDPGALLLEHLYYLTPPGYQMNSCDNVPAIPDGTPGTAKAWLTRHAGGNPAWGEKLYEGTPELPNRKPFKTSWADCMAVAETIFV